jgi:seryl-tRNA synthetase
MAFLRKAIMLDIKFIRENPDLVKKAVTDKQLTGTVDIDHLLEIDSKYSDTLKKVETYRSLKNKLSKAIAEVEPKEREKLIKESAAGKEALKQAEAELAGFKLELDNMLLWVPNPPADDVPFGKDDSGNVEVRKVGKIPDYDFEPKDHTDLGKSLNIIDTERGTKVGGFRGYYIKNEGADLEAALLKYAIDFMKTKGFDFFSSVPCMVKPEYFVGTGYFPWGAEDHYTVQDDLSLIGTAEVPLTSYYADEVLTENDLPKKFIGVSPAFRREIGSYGKDTKGVFRVHQFTKVEQVVLIPADENLSREWHEKMVGYAEELLQNLGLPYHVLLMCTGDMGPGQRKKYDIETWFASQKKYRETHSASYFNDFQARRLNIKYKTKDGSLKYVYTLNNTVAASPRLLAALLEFYQQKDGSVVVPEVLQKYVGFDKILPKK